MMLQKPLKCRNANCGAMCSPTYAEMWSDNPEKCPNYKRVEREKGEWEEERDEKHGISRFTCSQCGNVIQDVEDRITFFTFNRYCGRCGSKMRM